MRMRFCLFLIICITRLHAEDITTVDGQFFQNAKIVKHDAVGITISHESGITRIPFELLPEKLRQKFHYDPKLAQKQKAMENKMVFQKAPIREPIRKEKRTESRISSISFEITIIDTLPNGVIASAFITRRVSHTIQESYYDKLANMGRGGINYRNRTVWESQKIPYQNEVFIDNVLDKSLGEEFSGAFYPAGNYEYTDKNGDTRDIPRYAISEMDAINLLKYENNNESVGNVDGGENFKSSENSISQTTTDTINQENQNSFWDTVNKIFAVDKVYSEIEKCADSESFEAVKSKAMAGDEMAQTVLGVMYLDGKFVKQDRRRAMSWFRKAANMGYAQAQYQLGMMYSFGIGGIPEDEAEATRWYQKAADQGDVMAQCSIGMAYEYGWGVMQNYAEAIKWYQKSADQGFGRAQYFLGTLYEQGKGVPQDYTKAVEYLKKAADQGDPDAQKELQELRSLGY